MLGPGDTTNPATNRLESLESEADPPDDQEPATIPRPYRAILETSTARMNGSLSLSVRLFHFACLFLPAIFSRLRTRRSKAPGEEVSITQSVDAPSQSPLTSSLLSRHVRHEDKSCYDLAHRLHLSPPTINWSGHNDVQAIETTGISFGGFSDVWQGSLDDRVVAVKSLRCYSSPEFDPAEVSSVSTRIRRSLWVG